MARPPHSGGATQFIAASASKSSAAPIYQGFPMTDRTHPDSGRTNRGPVVSDLLARIAELEAQLEAIGAAHGQAPAQAIGPCVICGSDEPFTGTCGSGGDPRALCKQPAPQADSQPAPGVDSPLARRFGGCPSCGRSDCVAMSCTRADPADLLHIAARAPADSVLEDAARYRWLRQEHERVDPVCHLTWKRNLQRDSAEWANTAVLDTAIDAAMAAARKQGANHD